MQSLDQIWKDYDQYENEVAKATAKATLTECNPRYKNAWNKFKDKRAIRENLLPNLLARPPRGHPREESQKQIWRALIDYELKNTQRLSPGEVRTRVTFAYNQALLCFYHHSDLWFEAAMYQVTAGNPEAANDFFERGIQAVPSSIMLHFAYADYEESRKDVEVPCAVVFVIL